MKTLPDLPTTIRYLSDEESSRLKRRNPTLWRAPLQGCMTCSDDRVFTGVDGEEYACRCGDQWLLHRFLLHAGIGAHYQRLTWDDLDPQVLENEELMESILSYRDHARGYINRGIGLILRGTHGTGKTMISVLLMKALIVAGHDAYFTQFNDMLDLHTAGWRSAEDKQWFERRVTHAGFLVIDDVGKESKGRENISNPLFDQVIRTRVANDKPTIITTNFDKEQLQSGYGIAVMSLLSESAFIVNVPGMTYRDRLRARNQRELLNNLVRPVSLG